MKRGDCFSWYTVHINPGNLILEPTHSITASIKQLLYLIAYSKLFVICKGFERHNLETNVYIKRKRLKNMCVGGGGRKVQFLKLESSKEFWPEPQSMSICLAP